MNTIIPDHISVQKVPTYVPDKFVNEGISPQVFKKKSRFDRLLKKQSKKSKKFKGRKKKALRKLVSFDLVFDVAYNFEGGCLNSSQMRAIYNTLNNPISEQRFAKSLISHNLNGYIRNMPLYNRFFPDFVWKHEKVIVEIDGPTHLDPKQKAKDERRDQFLISQGWKIFRLAIPFNRSQLEVFITSLKKDLKDRLPM